MRNHPVDVVVAEVVALQYFQNVVAHRGDGIAEHCASLLVDVVQAVRHGEMTGRAHRASGLHVQEGQSLAVGAEERVLCSEAFLLAGLHEYCSGTIAEEHAGLAVGVVGY